MTPIVTLTPYRKTLTDQWLGSIRHNAEGIALRKTDRPRRVACVTSWPKRIGYCSILIEHILTHQTLQPDYIFLTLCESEFPEYEASLPTDLQELVRNDERVKLVWNGQFNARTFKKVLPILPALDDEDVVFVLDDDNVDLLPDDMLESRYTDLLEYDRPVTFLSPALDRTIWACGSACFTLRKRMLAGWEEYMDDAVLTSFNDDEFMTRTMNLNGYYPITGSKYVGTELDCSRYTITDNYAASTNGVWKQIPSFNAGLAKCFADRLTDMFHSLMTDPATMSHLNRALSTGIEIHVAMCECDQRRTDTILYNAIKSLLVTNSFLYKLDFNIFVPDYIDTSKITGLLVAHGIEHTIVTEQDVAEDYALVKSLVNYSGPYNKLPLWNYMRRYPWFLYLDDDIVVRKGFHPDTFSNFLASGKAFGMVDDYQSRYTSPVLYTEEYGLRTEFNTGVVLVDSSGVPDDFLVQFARVNDDYYTRHPDMPTYMAEQTPLNVLLKDSVCYIPDYLNFKPITMTVAPEPKYGAVIVHYAGFDKARLVESPWEIPYGQYYELADKFATLDRLPEEIKQQNKTTK